MEVLHSNTIGHGYREPIGSVDFYANGGEIQPKCNAVGYGSVCSTKFSYELLIDKYRSGEACQSDVLCHTLNFPTSPNDLGSDCIQVVEKRAQNFGDLETALEHAASQTVEKNPHDLSEGIMWLDTQTKPLHSQGCKFGSQSTNAMKDAAGRSRHIDEVIGGSGISKPLWPYGLDDEDVYNGRYDDGIVNYPLPDNKVAGTGNDDEEVGNAEPSIKSNKANRMMIPVYPKRSQKSRSGGINIFPSVDLQN